MCVELVRVQGFQCSSNLLAGLRLNFLSPAIPEQQNFPHNYFRHGSKQIRTGEVNGD